MTRAVYVVGGAGSGKSTFTGRLIEEFLGAEYGPLEALAAQPNKKNIVTLRGHRLAGDGMYLGVKRDVHPGTDGLDRATSPVGELWLRKMELPRYVVSEGATLATVRFLTALEDCTDFLLVHLAVDPGEAERRFASRGTTQDPSFVKATSTRAANRAREAEERGTAVLSIDTADPDSCEIALDLVAGHLLKK